MPGHVSKVTQQAGAWHVEACSKYLLKPECTLVTGKGTEVLGLLTGSFRLSFPDRIPAPPREGKVGAGSPPVRESGKGLRGSWARSLPWGTSREVEG